VLPALENSVILYWFLYGLSGVFLIIACVLLFYTGYNISYRKGMYLLVISVLRHMLILIAWIALIPFFEVFLSIFSCEGSYHKITGSLNCFGGVHIFLMILSILFMVTLLLIGLSVSIFFKLTQLNKGNAFARLENNGAVLSLLCRVILAIENTFISHVIYLLTKIGSWKLDYSH